MLVMAEMIIKNGNTYFSPEEKVLNKPEHSIPVAAERNKAVDNAVRNNDLP